MATTTAPTAAALFTSKDEAVLSPLGRVVQNTSGGSKGSRERTQARHRKAHVRHSIVAEEVREFSGTIRRLR